MPFNMINKPVLISAHPEKIIALLDSFWPALVIRTFAVDQLPFSIKTLASETVMSCVFTEIYIAIIIHSIEDHLHGLYMSIISGAYKVIVGDIQSGPQRSEHSAYSVYIFLSATPRLIGSLDDLFTIIF